jgi:hypothetical protein
MDFPRCYVSTAQLNGKMYCLGGYNGQVRYNIVECYDPETNNWSQVKPMLEIRSDACAVSYGNRIYCLGGFNGNHILQTTEIYDPEMNEWTYGPRLTSPRSGLKVNSKTIPTIFVEYELGFLKVFSLKSKNSAIRRTTDPSENLI